MKLLRIFLLAVCSFFILGSLQTNPDLSFAAEEPKKCGDGSIAPAEGCQGDQYDDIKLLAPFPGQDDYISTKELDAIGILGVYVSQIFTFGMALIAIFAVLMIMVAGYEYMFAGGDSSKADNAKTRISQALLGLVLVFLSALLLNIINPNFYKI